MKNRKPLIAWEKWQDPFLEKIKNPIPAKEDHEYDDSYIEDSIDDINHVKFPMILTPMGVLPYNENTACGSLFNFWVGHTNFDITNEIKNILEKSDGVESLDIFTRYRFRIGVGKAFKDSYVMRKINNSIYQILEK